MLVGKHCTRNVITIRKSETVVEAARCMRRYHVGDLVVVDGERDIPIGVLTDRDLVVSILAKDVEHLTQLEVGDVVTHEVMVAREDEDVSDVLHRMQKKGVRRVPVVDALGVLTGIFTLDDVLGLLADDMATVFALVKRQRQREVERRA
jgi:CBS domain-containing protein